MGTTFNQGQLAQLGNNLNIAIATALPKVAAKFEPKPLLKAMEGRGQFLADKLEPLLEQILNSLFVLGAPGTVSVTLAERHDPDDFFQTRSGLYIWDDFRSRIVSKAKPVEAGATFSLNHALLTKDMSDAEIEAVLPAQHFFDDTQVCAIIAAMIVEQWGGKESKLLNNGYVNLFYTSSFVVDVYWGAGYREWDVSTWRRGDRRWAAGSRVFSLATAT